MPGEVGKGVLHRWQFRSPGGLIQDRVHTYTVPATLDRNQWALAGKWLDDPEKATLQAAPGKIVFRFCARDLHLVLGPGKAGKRSEIAIRTAKYPLAIIGK